MGVGHDDGADDAERLAAKIATLRVFADGDGQMNLALADVGGEVLVVSQFTLYGDVRKGRRPSWAGAADPETAAAGGRGAGRRRSRLGASSVAAACSARTCSVELVNDGPVTLMLDSATL